MTAATAAGPSSAARYHCADALSPCGGVAEFHPVTGTAASAAQRPAGHPVRGEEPVDHLVHRTAGFPWLAAEVIPAAGGRGRPQAGGAGGGAAAAVKDV